MNLVRSTWLGNSSSSPKTASLFRSVAVGSYSDVMYNHRRTSGETLLTTLDRAVTSFPGGACAGAATKERLQGPCCVTGMGGKYAVGATARMCLCSTAGSQ